MEKCPQKQKIFEFILNNLTRQFTPEIWTQLYTKNGQTQSAESISKHFVRSTLSQMINNSMINGFSEA